MKLIALMPARNEEWVIGLSLRVACLWADEVIVLDHASTDRTAEIVAEVAAETGKVHVLTEADPTWAEMAHRQRLLECARTRGATHIAIADADEVLTGNLLPAIRPALKSMNPGQILQIPMRNMHRSIDCYRSDRSPFGYAITTVGFADSPVLGWRDKDGYPHHQREPRGSIVGQRVYPNQVDGGVMHLQFASWRWLLAKHALYKASERVRFPNKTVREIERMYNLSSDETGLQTTKADAAFWEPYQDWLQYLNLDVEPWQEAEVRRLVDEHGRETFEGLNLFGVA